MLVRTLRPVDMVALASFQRRAGATEITAHSWPRVEPESGRLPYASLMSASLGHRPGGQRTWLAESGDCVVGLAIARPRAGGLAWDVIHLHADADADGAAAEMLEQVAATAGSHAGRRVFLETPLGGRGTDVARRAAFERFTSSELLYADAGLQG